LEVEVLKKRTPLLWREAHLQVKKCTKHTILGTLLEVDTSKKCALLRREAQVKNVPNTPFSDHFWKLTRRKSARCCGAKHISKSKCEKHHMFGPLLDVQMSFCVAGAGDFAPCQK